MAETVAKKPSKTPAVGVYAALADESHPGHRVKVRTGDSEESFVLMIAFDEDVELGKEPTQEQLELLKAKALDWKRKTGRRTAVIRNLKDGKHEVLAKVGFI